jgi:NADH-quinone oxidoreductase subunit G/NADP-reducing hydrogenase subunit HndD
MITLTIDNQQVAVEEGTSVLEAAREAGIDIPTLCYLKDLNAPAACRVCIVQVEGRPTFDASCVLPAENGMVVYTNTPEVLAARKQILELFLSDHPFECLTCERSLNCELQRLPSVTASGICILKESVTISWLTISPLPWCVSLTSAYAAAAASLSAKIT